MPSPTIRVEGTRALISAELVTITKPPRSIEAGQQILGECRQRIVARAHDDDAVAGAGDFGDALAAILARADVLGCRTILAARRRDQANDPLAALAATD